MRLPNCHLGCSGQLVDSVGWDNPKTMYWMGLRTLRGKGQFVTELAGLHIQQCDVKYIIGHNLIVISVFICN